MNIRRETALLAGSFGFSLWLVLAMPVLAQEAYYWCYAQHPDLSYFDHPPMVAWLIWGGTHLFGDGVLGLRLGTWLCGCGLTLVGLAALRDFGATTKARSAWICLSVAIPYYGVIHFLATPDAPLTFFWALSALALWRARDGALRWWALSGLAAGLALMSKYSASFLAIGGCLLLVVDPRYRTQLRRPGPWFGLILACIAFLPVVIWNVSNDFESFRFQTGGRFAKATFGFRWFGQCVLGQFFIAHPLLVCVMPAVLKWLWRADRRRDGRTTFLLAFGLPMAVTWVVASAWIQVKINWFVPAYFTLALGAVLWWTESGVTTRHPKLAKIAERIILGTLVVLALGPVMRLMPQGRGSTWTGWSEIAKQAEAWEETLDAEDKIDGNVFFFTSSYRDAAQLRRSLVIETTHAGADHVLEPTMAENVLGSPALQFDHWESPAKHIGQDAIFVLSRPERHTEQAALVAGFFDSIERVEHVEVATLGIVVLRADIFCCRGYRGPIQTK